MAADNDALQRLHSAIADKLTDALEEMSSDTKGLAAILNVARQFVKDNGIEALPVPGRGVGAVAEKLAAFPFDASTDRSH